MCVLERPRAEPAGWTASLSRRIFCSPARLTSELHVPQLSGSTVLALHNMNRLSATPATGRSKVLCKAFNRQLQQLGPSTEQIEVARVLGRGTVRMLGEEAQMRRKLDKCHFWTAMMAPKRPAARARSYQCEPWGPGR